MVETSKIESLSPTQIKTMEEVSQRWRTSAREAVDRPAVEHAIAALYSDCGLTAPVFIWCESVFQYVLMNAFLFLVASDSTNEIGSHLDSELNETHWVNSWTSLKTQLAAAPELIGQMRARMEKVADGNPIVRKSSLGSTHLMEHAGNTSVEQKLSVKFSEATSEIEKVLPTVFGTKAKLQLRTHLRQLKDDRSDMLRGRFADRSIRTFLPANIAEIFSSQLSRSTQEKIDSCCGCLTKRTSFLEVTFGSPAVKMKLIELIFRDLIHESTNLIPDRFFVTSIPDEMVVFAFVADQLRSSLDEKAARLLDNRLTIIDSGIDYTPYRFVCFITEPPQLTVLNERGFLHNENGPAIIFRDGFEVFAINGVTIPIEVLNQSISIEQIDKEQNVEVRRVMIHRYGMDKYIEDSGAKVISQDEYGILYKKDMARDEPIVMVKVTNATKEPDGSGAREFFLRVPPYMMTAKDAVAWTFQLDGNEYEPDLES